MSSVLPRNFCWFLFQEKEGIKNLSWKIPVLNDSSSASDCFSVIFLFSVDVWQLFLSSVICKLIPGTWAMVWAGQDELEANIREVCDLHFICYLQRCAKWMLQPWMSGNVCSQRWTICVHLKAKAVSISLCKDTKAQLSPEIRVAVNIKSLVGYEECSGAVTLFWVLLELETPSGHCLHLYLPLHIQNLGACSFTWPCSAWLCIVNDFNSILCIHCFIWGVWLPSLWLQAGAVGLLQGGQQRWEPASRLTGTLWDKFSCVIFAVVCMVIARRQPELKNVKNVTALVFFPLPHLLMSSMGPKLQKKEKTFIAQICNVLLSCGFKAPSCTNQNAFSSGVSKDLTRQWQGMVWWH